MRSVYSFFCSKAFIPKVKVLYLKYKMVLSENLVVIIMTKDRILQTLMHILKLSHLRNLFGINVNAHWRKGRCMYKFLYKYIFIHCIYS